MPDNDNEAEGLTILGALAQLKEDIRRLQEKDEKLKRAPMFLIQEGELELKLTVVKDIKAEAKGMAKFKLILAGEASVGASGGISQESLQTLKIKFRALLPQEAAEYVSEKPTESVNIQRVEIPRVNPVFFNIDQGRTTVGDDPLIKKNPAVVIKQGPRISKGRTKKLGGTTAFKRR